METIHNIKTRVNKTAEPVVTALTIDWDITDEQLRTLATATVIIRYQAIVRDSGKIPTTDTLKVSSLFVKRERSAPQPMTPEKVLEKAKADPAFLEALKALMDAQHK